jgi:hippurate hydrolase
VVSIGTVRSGTASNVIPDAAILTGTIRAFEPETRALLHAEIRRTAEGVAAAHGLDARIEMETGPPPIVNPTEPVEWARAAVRKLLGEVGLVSMGSPNMGGEDFAYYLERLPGAFLRIGAREPDGDVIPAHTPRFYAADPSIFVGAAVLAETARIAARALDPDRREG